MTGVYCGRCGSASGASSRFCRSCGGEIVVYVVEPGAQRPRMAVEPESSRGTEWPEEHNTARRSGQAEATDDALPEAVDKLRRLRNSGRLLIDEGMKRQEPISGIIWQATRGVEADKGHEVEWTDSPGRREQGVPPEGPGESPRGRGQEYRPLTPEPGGAIRPVRAVKTQRTRITPIAEPPGGATPAMHAGAVRGGVASSGGVQPQGPSQVLASASGLEPPGRSGFGVRLGLALLVIIGAIGSYIVFRERTLGTLDVAGEGRDLMRPEDLSARYIGMGEEERRKGNHEAAIEWFRRAEKLTPGNAQAMLLLARGYGEAGRPDESLETYLSLVRQHPDNLEARWQVASIYRQRNDWDLALREYRRIIALDQNSSEAALALEAIEARESSLKGEPKPARRKPRPSPTLLSGPVLPMPTLKQNEMTLVQPRLGADPGISSLKGPRLEAAGEKPDPAALAEARKDRGLRYLNIREYRAAIKEFLIALQITPEDRDLCYFIGSAYFGLQEPAMAYDYYRRVDRGKYLQVAQAGARRTEKAAEEYRRRMNQRKAELPEESQGTGSKN